MQPFHLILNHTEPLESNIFHYWMIAALHVGHRAKEHVEQHAARHEVQHEDTFRQAAQKPKRFWKDQDHNMVGSNKIYYI